MIISPGFVTELYDGTSSIGTPDLLSYSSIPPLLDPLRPKSHKSLFKGSLCEHGRNLSPPFI